MAPMTRSQAKSKLPTMMKAAPAKATKSKNITIKHPTEIMSKVQQSMPADQTTSMHNAPPTHPVILSENGLLNLEKTPDHLVDIVKRNGTESRLLRLPSEIRNAIWQYVLGGEDIEITSIWNSETHECSTGRMYRHREYPRNKQLYIFCLPQVCRQIYSETATSAFAFNTFSFINLDTLKYWSLMLLPAQLNMITSVGVMGESIALFRYGRPADFDIPVHTPVALKTMFPSLTHVCITKATSMVFKEYEKEYGTWTPLPNRNNFIQHLIKEVEGEDVQVIVRDLDVSERTLYPCR